MKTRKRGFLRTMVSALAIFMALTLAAPAALAKGYELDNFAGPDNLIYGGKFYSEQPRSSTAKSLPKALCC